ncbi:hypothetical protein MICAE_40005 [Microcystis aeruginosa PCC 9806]|uniref:HNH endonuclease n=2 Tax=Microcystis TaxID=1125 RepID=A0A552LVQ2_9CHRO|nr:HNH endonuclease [Microcystis aeruginosa]TRV24288.1 MAG: HNH endonuclease [Microcystis flos-aquae Mf_WU_F_19750830_S460]CCI14681.1 hypothetical protein MICAE_40005 [Microcystis aeruginosa PCC 9806]
MSKELTRNQIFEILDTKPTNPRWSWCAISPDHKRAIFTLWDDKIRDGKYKFLSRSDPLKNRPGENDQRRILELVTEKNILTYGLVCIAKDITASPRSIKEIDNSYILNIKINKDNGNYVAIIKEKTLILEIVNEIKKENRKSLSSIADLPIGSEIPDRANRVTSSFVRDNKVRKFVLNRAGGQCEYCGKIGFEIKDNKYYIETHHIIALENNGKDTIDNVIGLCPNHHREAHYGIDGDKLELEFIKILTAKMKAAQQGDAPEPATKAISASQPSIAPAR